MDEHEISTNNMEQGDIVTGVVIPAVKKRSFSGLEIGVAWGCLLLGFLFTRYVCGFAGGLWGGILWALVGGGWVICTRAKGTKLSAIQAITFAIAEVFCFAPLFCSNGFINTLAAVFSFLLYCCLGLSVNGGELFGRHFAADLAQGVFAHPLYGFADAPRAAASLFHGGKRAKNLLYVAVGLVAALPLSAVVLLCLKSSDGLFEELINNAAKFLPRLSGELVWQVVFAVPAGMYLFGIICGDKQAAEHCETPRFRLLPEPMAYAAVTPVCVFYLLYILTQLRYFTAAFGGELPEGYSYSEFARRGFFELCVVAVINLGVIVVLQLFTRRGADDSRPKGLVGYTVVICGFTLLLIASAMSKMVLYIAELGMTPLRIYTTWFMLLLGIVFVLIIALQFKEFAFWRAAFAVFTGMMAVLCFGNIDGMIASYNISAYEQGQIAELDVNVFRELGAAAVKPAYDLYERLDEGDVARGRLAAYLGECSKQYKEEDFAYFSVQRAMARGCVRKVGGSA